MSHMLTSPRGKISDTANSFGVKETNTFDDYFSEDFENLSSAIRQQFSAQSKATLSLVAAHRTADSLRADCQALQAESLQYRAAIDDHLDVIDRCLAAERAAKSALEVQTARCEDLVKQLRASKDSEDKLRANTRQLLTTNDSLTRENAHLRASMAGLEQQVGEVRAEVTRRVAVEKEQQRAQQDAQRATAELERKLQDALMQSVSLPALTQQRDQLRRQLDASEAERRQLVAQITRLKGSSGAGASGHNTGAGMGQTQGMSRQQQPMQQQTLREAAAQQLQQQHQQHAPQPHPQPQAQAPPQQRGRRKSATTKQQQSATAAAAAANAAAAASAKGNGAGATTAMTDEASMTLEQARDQLYTF